MIGRWCFVEKGAGRQGKKAQMEMIGLVIIVILITLGMLFLVLFALKSDPEKKIFTRKGLAYSTMSSVMKTTVYDINCISSYSGEAFPQLGKDILEDCAEHYDTRPNGYSDYNCGSKHSCVFFEQEVEKLLAMTLGEWKKRYEFRSQLVQVGAAQPTILAHVKGEGGCQKKERDTSGLFPVQAGDAGLVENVLYVCD